MPHNSADFKEKNSWLIVYAKPFLYLKITRE